MLNLKNEKIRQVTDRYLNNHQMFTHSGRKMMKVQTLEVKDSKTGVVLDEFDKRDLPQESKDEQVAFWLSQALKENRQFSLKLPGLYLKNGNNQKDLENLHLESVLIFKVFPSLLSSLKMLLMDSFTNKLVMLLRFL